MGAPKRATIYAVADRAQVSIATVSRVLRGSEKVAPETRDRVLAAASTLDYSPDASAASLAEKRTHVLGLVLPEINGAYYTELLTGFDDAAAELGRSVMLVLGTDHLAKRVRQLETRVDGLAVMNSSGLIATDALARAERRLPVVSIAARVPDGGVGISTECRDNAQVLTQHLLDHGRRKLLFVGDPSLAWDAEHRYAGFRDTLVSAGLRPTEPVRIPYWSSHTDEVVRSIIVGDLDADGLVCVNDEVALGMQYHLRLAGVRVGTDIALTGWDDVPAARFVQPGLTTVAQPVRELGRTAAIRLVERIEGGDTASSTQLLPTTVVVRGSCGCTEAPESLGRPAAGAPRAPRGSVPAQGPAPSSDQRRTTS